MKEHPLIHDAELVKKFFDTVAVDLEDDEVFILMAQARRKYVNDDERTFGHDPILMKQFIKDNDAEYFLWKVRQLLGKAQYGHDRMMNHIPLKSLVAYFDVSPKATLRAFNDFVQQTNEDIYGLVKTPNHHSFHKIRRIKSTLESKIHIARSRKPYLIIDIDTKENEFVDDVWTYMTRLDMQKHIRWMTETNGGYHIILEKNDYVGKRIYLDMKEAYQKSFNDGKIEIKSSGGPMTPVPGTIQGGFKTRRVTSLTNKS